MENISDRLKQIRKHFDLSQNEFSDIIKVGSSTLAMWETGSRKIKDIHIALICKELSISETWLRTGDGQMIDELDREEAITAWASKITRSDFNNEFIKDFAEALTKLDEDDWKTLEKLAKFLMEGQKKKD